MVSRRPGRERLPVSNASYVVVGYGVTLGALVGYVVTLLARARRARARAAAVADRRGRRGGP